MDRGAVLRAPLRFRTLFLSTGEVGIADKIAEAGGVVKAGQEVRLVDVPADAGAGLGLFEELHDAASAAAFTQSIRDATARRYGTAAPAFLRYILARLDREPELPAELRRWQDDLVRGWLEPHADAGGQVRTVARRFGLVAIAGELATIADVTGWAPNDATDAAATCFRAWLAERGTAGAREDAQAVTQMRSFISMHGPSRFEEWRDPAPVVEAAQGDGDLPPPVVEAAQGDGDLPPPERFRAVNRVGWRRWLRDGDWRPAWRYYVLPNGMHEALTGLDFKAAIKVLIERGFLIPGKDKSSQSANPPGHPKARVYVLRASILGADEAGD